MHNTNPTELIDYYKQSLDIAQYSAKKFSNNEILSSSDEFSFDFNKIKAQAAKEYSNVVTYNATNKKKKYFKGKKFSPESFLRDVIGPSFENEMIFFAKLSMLDNILPSFDTLDEELNDIDDTDPDFKIPYSKNIGIGLVHKGVATKKESIVPLWLFPSYTTSINDTEHYINTTIEAIQSNHDDTPLNMDVVVNTNFLDMFFKEDIEIDIDFKGEASLKNIKSFLLGLYKISKVQESEYCFKYFFHYSREQGMNFGLHNLLSNIEKNGTNKLLGNFFNVVDAKKSKIVNDAVDYSQINTSVFTHFEKLEAMHNHFGSFDGSNPLASSQREAFHSHIALNSDILAVNGAPGTGKTSLLRAIVADKFVKDAILSYNKFILSGEIEMHLPVISISTNNRALINIAQGINESFNEISPEFNRLFTLWINNSKFNEHLPSKYSISDDGLIAPLIKNNYAQKDDKNSTDIFLKDSIISLHSSLLENIHDITIDFIENFKTSSIGVNYNFESDKKEFSSQLLEIIALLNRNIQENIQKISKTPITVNHAFEQLGEFEKTFFVDHLNLYEDFIALSADNMDKMVDTLKKTIDSLQKKEHEKDNIAEKTKFIQLLIEKNTSLALKIKELKEEKKLKIQLYKDTEFAEIVSQKLKSLNDISTKKCDENIKQLKDNASFTDKLLNAMSFGQLHSAIAQEKTTLQTAKKINKNAADSYGSKLFTLRKKNIEGEYSRELSSLDAEIKENDISKKEKKACIALSKKSLESIRDNINEYKSFIVDLFNGKYKYDLIKALHEKMSYLHMADTKQQIADYIPIDEEIDLNERLLNFIYSIHMQEAFFLLKHIGTQKTKSTVEIRPICPVCKAKSFSFIGSNSYYGCASPKCNVMFYPDQVNNHVEVKNTKRALSNKEIDSLFENGTINIAGQNYEYTQNKGYINIRKTITPSRLALVMALKELSFLMPIISTTCHSYGSVFSDIDKKIDKDLFDLMLIDESATILPNQVLAMYGAKKAILFGDSLQLKPIYPYTRNSEEALISSRGLGVNFIDWFGVSINSAMDIANRAAYINFPNKTSSLDGDIWLKEHFRCRKSIISICNELTYHNEIELLKEDIPGENHLTFVEHFSKSNDDTNTNTDEAYLIAQYITENEDIWRERYGYASREELCKNIVVLSPFKSQTSTVSDILQEEFGYIECGTIHSIQGGERTISIFSTVYNYNTKKKAKKMFFNRGDSDMFNVAISRAKEEFVLFGSKDILTTPDTHSSVVMKHILNPDVSTVKFMHKRVIVGGKRNFLDTHEEHHKAFKKYSKLAKKSITIISPWIRKESMSVYKQLITLDKSVEVKIIFGYSDNEKMAFVLLNELEDKKVIITQEEMIEIYNKNNIEAYIDSFLQKEDVPLVVKYILFYAKLLSFCATIEYQENEHRKIVVFDDDVAFIGSYNWLSASLDVKYQKKESSYIIKESEVVELIRKSLATD